MVLELKGPDFILLFHNHCRRQRAELWEVIAALQASRPIHLGVDNDNVVGHVGRIIVTRLQLGLLSFW